MKIIKIKNFMKLLNYKLINISNFGIFKYLNYCKNAKNEKLTLICKIVTIKENQICRDHQ